MQQLAGARGGVVAIDLGHLLVGGCHRVPILGGNRRFLGHQHRMYLDITGHHEINRRIRQRRRLLGHAGDAQLGRLLQVTGIGLDLA